MPKTQDLDYWKARALKAEAKDAKRLEGIRLQQKGRRKDKKKEVLASHILEKQRAQHAIRMRRYRAKLKKAKV